MKNQYKAGKYRLTKETGVWGKTVPGEEVYVNLTAGEVKSMFKIYNKIGFCIIERTDD